MRQASKEMLPHHQIPTYLGYKVEKPKAQQLKLKEKYLGLHNSAIKKEAWQWPQSCPLGGSMTSSIVSSLCRKKYG